MLKTQTTEEEKEFQNIDFTNTTAYRTVKAYNKEGIHWEKGEGPAGQIAGIPNDEFTQCKRLKKLDTIVKPEHGPITKEITHMSRFLVKQRDDKGKIISGEYLTLQGPFQGFDFAGMEVGQEFTEGWSKKPVIHKVYRGSKRFDEETGADLGKEEVTGSTFEYFYQLPKDAAKRKKYIDSLIENANGTFAENIIYYYKELGSGNHPSGSKSDDTYSYEQFTELSIEELRALNGKGGGANASGYYRDRDNRLRDRNDNLV